MAEQGKGLVLFGGRTEYPAVADTPQTVDTPGFAQVVYIEVKPGTLEAILAMFERWFEAREEVEIVDYGTSDKKGLPFIVIDWFESEIDQLFFDILHSEDAIIDYTEYSREVD